MTGDRLGDRTVPSSECVTVRYAGHCAGPRRRQPVPPGAVPGSTVRPSASEIGQPHHARPRPGRAPPS
eukprot:752458-Hanusia_phi.AAC.1